MRAGVVGEDDERVALSVVDANDVAHHVEMGFEGDIEYHSQEGYPDKVADRTDAENEYTAQVRRYARYYIYREKGYRTVEPRTNPDVLSVVAVAIARRSPAAFEAQFGDYYQQFRSTVEDDVDPVVTVSADAGTGLTVYRQNVYLDVPVTDRLDAETARALGDARHRPGDTDETLDALSDVVDGEVAAPSTPRIDGVSGIGALYQTATGDETIAADDPHSGPPDARLELSPVDPEWEEYLSVEEFQLLVVHHLLCQIRDCYLRMGMEPPEGVRILGLGSYRQTVRNEHVDIYDPVHYTDSPVDGYRLPGLGTHLGA